MSWSEARDVAKRLIEAGHRTVFAGGCVRDRLLGRSGADIDIATAAHPDEVIALFERTVAVGASFGVVLVVGEDDTYDVATFRRDIGVGDGRHPAAIEPSTLEHDVERRDFTVNGLVQDPLTDDVIDLVGGLADLEARVIRAIGDPELRFREDGLRLLRAVRFAARLDFSIEPVTGRALRNGAARLDNVSGERIGAEIFKMFGDPGRARAHRLLAEHGQLERALPGVPAPDEAPDAQRVLAELPADASPTLGLAVLLADPAARTDATALALHLRRSRDETRHIASLVEDAETLDTYAREGVSTARWRRLLAQPHADDLLTWRAARARVEAKRAPSDAVLAALRERFGADVAQIPRPLLDGRALIDAGVSPGAMVGEATRALVDAQLEGQLDDADAAHTWVVRWLASGRREGPQHQP